ncbi:hypothetical protein L6452_16884 [Arctium lappa]|uniref:Uncharacterized protein n=1 Tax=Arctium lappa TaxID=4217 RepID=A0ACB9C1R7_ARCLA|nr:hypothetical protein L6452_16884 [Arctium lappa]
MISFYSPFCLSPLHFPSLLHQLLFLGFIQDPFSCCRVHKSVQKISKYLTNILPDCVEVLLRGRNEV